jgi:hypothetical protein
MQLVANRFFVTKGALSLPGEKARASGPSKQSFGISLRAVPRCETVLTGLKWGWYPS